MPLKLDIFVSLLYLLITTDIRRKKRIHNCKFYPTFASFLRFKKRMIIDHT